MNIFIMIKICHSVCDNYLNDIIWIKVPNLEKIQDLSKPIKTSEDFQNLCI